MTDVGTPPIWLAYPPIRSTVEQSTTIIGTTALDTIHIKSPVIFTYQIKEPIQFEFIISKVMHGERDTENRG